MLPALAGLCIARRFAIADFAHGVKGARHLYPMRLQTPLPHAAGFPMLPALAELRIARRFAIADFAHGVKGARHLYPMRLQTPLPHAVGITNIASGTTAARAATQVSTNSDSPRTPTEVFHEAGWSAAIDAALASLDIDALINQNRRRR